MQFHCFMKLKAIFFGIIETSEFYKFIIAVIVETGINQDGQTKGISLPNPDAQFRLLQQVYQRAGVPAEQLSYIEAHGTGT